MSYTSKRFQKNWTYDPQGTTHNDRIGQILAGGKDLSATLRMEAMEGVQAARNDELAVMAHARNAPKPLHETSVSFESKETQGRGMVWVDNKTKTDLGAVTDEPFTKPLREAGQFDTLNEKQIAVAALTPNQRSMHLWRKLNPGCMESTIKVPIATAQDTFKMRDGIVHNPDKEQFRKKTEFTAYVEAQMRHVGTDR
ncbi:hypothetical protein FOA52_008983 [Chlamydomonas sp. UWO 241]|nr:hypothetical protein FOA52_008983 [Chlamydomonas sp. UWO 241]